MAGSVIFESDFAGNSQSGPSIAESSIVTRGSNNEGTPWGLNDIIWRRAAGIGHITKLIELDAKIVNNGIMKTTVDIPESVLKEAMGFTKARTKRQAIVTALEDFNHRRRMAGLLKHAGTCDGWIKLKRYAAKANH